MAEIAKTHWIWVPAWKEEINGKPRLVRFRKVFKMTREEILQYECLKLKISADTRYKLYVNGVFVKFGPARGDSRVWYCDETDIAPWLREGENVIAGEVLRYPLEVMPPNGLKGPITMESLLYVMGLQHAAKLCEYIGRSDTAREYMERAESVQKAVNAYCRDEEGIYLDGPGVYEYSQHCQVFAVLTDTVSLAEGRKLLGKTLKEQEKYARCSVSMTPYLFQALARADLYEETCKLWDIWRDMVRDNLTTCVENDIDGRSDCHAWGSLILYKLPAVILGVRPAAPGRLKLEYQVPEALEGKVEVLSGQRDKSLLQIVRKEAGDKGDQKPVHTGKF